jgi:xanthine/uracil/vitamin C permease (AzgA family)
MLLDSITPIEFQIYVLIGAFLISLFIDIIFSMKRKEWRFYTFSNFSAPFWFFIFIGILIMFFTEAYDKWQRGLYIIPQIFYFTFIFFPYYYFLYKVHFEILKKDPESFEDIFIYLKRKFNR